MSSEHAAEDRRRLRRPEVSDSGVYDTSTLEKDVTAVVNVTFALG